ncbi:LacI family transcriptional regulator [Bifidobacterium lemurum]|uniref:LacI family transcriptional regulator n=1 Tax=Bifidobacterium lemurum TaxID=1603886 RepID=A0A261FRZ3_9BIFI|nr:LacI family DNA-binding transcriptional regulator [Bifidobacterium lemurum]OZG61909.1 LacI family transcriptional regulator [Bifidobacterium lemurum]QOL33298.1 LacI family DNA-binding transcriptional regulator [Bifidobacterium lemurum]
MAYVTIRDVAKHAGISVSTVSRALNGNGRISKETKATVERAVAELNYIPDSRAQAMRSSKTRTVGLLVPDIRNGYFAELAYSIQDALFDAGYCTFIGTSSESASRQDAFIMSILAQHIDGAIIVPQGESSDALKLLVERELPVVFVDRRVDGLDDVPLVDSDPLPGMRAALEDLRAHGFTKIGYVSGPVHTSPTLRERESVFRALACEMVGEEHVFVESTSFDQASCGSVLKRMSDAGVRALIFGYSQDMLRAMSLMGSMGLRMGEDFSMVSFDDLELFRLASPQVSVISQQVRQIGCRGARLFLDMVGEPERGMRAQSRSQRVETIYVPRGSVGDAR